MENEVLELLKSSKRQNNMVGILPGSDIGNTIIKALEEVQQYRKHGVTVESALNNMCDLTAAENLIEKYRAIGTPEECLRNKDFLDFLSDKMNPNDFETYLRLYNALEEKGCEE